MKTQTQTETETEAETKTGVHQQPQHALVAGARTFIWPWPMAQCLIRLRVRHRVRVGQAGAPRTHRCTSTSTSMAIVLEASLARINFRPTLFTVCSARFSLCSARVCSLSELSARGFPASILGSGSSRVRPSGATFTFDFYGQQRQLALNFSSSFIVYAFTYAAHVPPLFWHTLSPFLWHLARFLFKIHNCRRQRRVIVGEFATPCCLAASRLPPPAASAPFPCYSFGAAKKSITFLHMFQLRVTLRCAYVICCCRGCCRKKTTSHPWCSN